MGRRADLGRRLHLRRRAVRTTGLRLRPRRPRGDGTRRRGIGRRRSTRKRAFAERRIQLASRRQRSVLTPWRSTPNVRRPCAPEVTHDGGATREFQTTSSIRNYGSKLRCTFESSLSGNKSSCCRSGYFPIWNVVGLPGAGLEVSGPAEEDVDYPGPAAAVLARPVPNLATAAFPIAVAPGEAAVPC